MKALISHGLLFTIGVLLGFGVLLALNHAGQDTFVPFRYMMF